MLKKSTANPEPPNLEEGKPRGKGAGPQPAQAKTKTGGSKEGVILTEARPSKTSSTFRAPRSSEGGGAIEQGFTKVRL